MRVEVSLPLRYAAAFALSVDVFHGVWRGAPKYDPVSGELIAPMPVQREPAHAQTVHPGAIPMAQSVQPGRFGHSGKPDDAWLAR